MNGRNEGGGAGGANTKKKDKRGDQNKTGMSGIVKVD